MENILVFGGTFDPIHYGHLVGAEEVATQLNARVLLVPAGDPPNKNHTKLNADTRYHMVCAAVAGHPLFEVTDVELNRKGKSYTYQTIEILKERYQNDNLYLLMGADQAKVFHTWREYERLTNLCAPVAMLRPPFRLEDLNNWKWGIANVRQFDVSSTLLRERLAAADYESFLVQSLIPPTVLQYIREHQLYR